MKQIVDKLNDIAKAIDPNVTLPTTNLITDSLDAITKAYGGTPTDSDLIVDKLGDIAENVTGGGGSGEGNFEYEVGVVNYTGDGKTLEIPYTRQHANAPTFVCVMVDTVQDYQAGFKVLTLIDFGRLFGLGTFTQSPQRTPTYYINGFYISLYRSNANGPTGFKDSVFTTNGATSFSNYVTNTNVNIPKEITNLSGSNIPRANYHWVAYWFESGTDD